MERDPSYVIDVYVAAQKAIEFLGGKSQAEFIENESLQSSILWQIGIMGTATQEISDDFKDFHDGIEWHKIAGMRNHIVHGYRGVNFIEVWDTVVRDLPILVTQLEEIIRQYR